MSKAVKVDKDYVEKVVIEDLRKKYPDITELEFRRVAHKYGTWVAAGIFKTSRGFVRAFMYVIDRETGEILEYEVII